jgi:hypothetical protein
MLLHPEARGEILLLDRWFLSKKKERNSLKARFIHGASRETDYNAIYCYLVACNVLQCIQSGAKAT